VDGPPNADLAEPSDYNAKIIMEQTRKKFESFTLIAEKGVWRIEMSVGEFLAAR
jgi:hypothetical protein